MNTTITTSNIKNFGKEGQVVLLNWMNDNGINPTDVCEISIDPENPVLVTTLEYKRDENGVRIVLADLTVAQVLKEHPIDTYPEEVDALFNRVFVEVITQ